MSDLVIAVGKKYVDSSGRIAQIVARSEALFPYMGSFISEPTIFRFWDQNGRAINPSDLLVAEYTEPKFSPSAYEVKNDGGPAFPLPMGSETTQGTDGMSLRDYIATKALNGICSSGPDSSWSNLALAKEAYSIADAMLAARGMSNT
jgi:hypothetical protein